jgi:putative hydrolase of the HAD superfamily
MPIRWVIFDAVGTLMRPQPPVARAYWEAGRRHGSGLEEAEVGRRFRAAFADFERSELTGADPGDAAVLQTTEAHESRRWRTIVERVFDDLADCDACFADLYEHFARPAAWEFFADIEPAVRALHARGVAVAVASNFDERLARVLREHPLTPLLRFVLPSSSVGYRKPSRHFFDRVRERAACAPEEMLYVGDEWQNDVQAARNAGISGLHIDRHALESAPGRITDLRQIAGRLRS